MKNFFIIYLIIITFISCITNDDSSVSSTSYNPPDSIHGSWKVENATNNTSEFQFTSNDIILLYGFVNISHKEQIDIYSNIGYDISVEELIFNDDYSVDFDYPQGMSVNYSLFKIDGQTIKWNDSSFGTVLWNEFKQLKTIFPPLNEQIEISDIETSTQKTETAINLKQQEIAKLKEYKSSLIDSVVTSKVRVC